MRELLERVLDLQLDYSSLNTAAMGERGKIVRDEIPGWVRQQMADELAAGLKIAGDDLVIQGRDGTGPKSRVPWVRVASAERSPHATDGFYVVYLFSADRESVYLTLGQATTTNKGGNFPQKPAALIEARRKWALDAIGPGAVGLSVTPEISLDSQSGSLGAGYEAGAILQVRYDRGSVPEDEALVRDLLGMVSLLSQIYSAHGLEPVPDENPEVDFAEEVASVSVGAKKTPAGAGFRVNAQEIKAVERRAVDLARAHYEDDGWNVIEKGKPFDLLVTKGSEELHVEVKGTVSQGRKVVLTRGEVEHHKGRSPNNALVIVRGIKLDRSEAEATANGGELRELRGWTIDGEALTVISFMYETPASFHESGE
jgi:hypothetical protein